MVAVNDRQGGLVVDAGAGRASVVDVGWGGKQRAAEWRVFGHNPVTLLPPNHVTAESGFHTVQAHRCRPPCLSCHFLHETF